MAGAVAERLFSLQAVPQATFEKAERLIEDHPKAAERGAVSVVLAFGLLLASQASHEEASRAQFAYSANTPQFVGPHSELDNRGQIPKEFRSPTAIIKMLEGKIPTSRVSEVAAWRQKLGVRSISAIVPEDKEGQFTAIAFEETRLTDLPGENFLMPTEGEESKVIPRQQSFDFDYILAVDKGGQKKEYGVSLGSMREVIDGKELWRVWPLFFAMDTVRIVTGLPPRFPQTHSQIRASFYGRQLPRNQPPRVTRPDYNTRGFSRTNSSFWASSKGTR